MTRRLWPRLMLFLLPAIFHLAAAKPGLADEPSPSDFYRTAASILALPPEKTISQHPALVHGVVTQSIDQGLVIQDSTAGIWIYWDRFADFTPGDDVEVDGVVEPGLYAPVVRAFSIHKLGRAPLPAPKEVTFRQLSAGEEECQYVSVIGTVRSVAVRKSASPNQQLWLRIDMGTASSMPPFRWTVPRPLPSWWMLRSGSARWR